MSADEQNDDPGAATQIDFAIKSPAKPIVPLRASARERAGRLSAQPDSQDRRRPGLSGHQCPFGPELTKIETAACLPSWATVACSSSAPSITANLRAA